MALYTAFGINGVGKDTVLQKVQEAEPCTRIISETKLLMYGLGILRSYDESAVPTREDYLALEHTPQTEVKVAEDSFAEILSDEAATEHPTIMTSHLIPAQLLLGKVVYLEKPKPPSLHVFSRALVQFVAPAHVILARRNGDERDRGSVTIDDIAYHQSLCDMEWERLQDEARSTGSSAEFMTIANDDLAATTERMLNIIKGSE
jgi:adenylate kinase